MLAGATATTTTSGAALSCNGTPCAADVTMRLKSSFMGTESSTCNIAVGGADNCALNNNPTSCCMAPGMGSNGMKLICSTSDNLGPVASGDFDNCDNTCSTGSGGTSASGATGTSVS